jgi:aarF domain-containing kinase
MTHEGVSDPYSKKVVEQDTKFCCFSVTKAVSAAAVHMLEEEGLIDFDQPVARYWSQFGKNGKEGITIRQVLNHQSGLQHAGTSELASDPFIVCDSESIMSIMADATPDCASGYHYLSFGFILDGLVRSVTSMGLQEFVERKISVPLGMSGTFSIGHRSDDCMSDVATLVLKKNQKSLPEGSSPQSQAPANSSRRPVDSPSLLLNPTFLGNNPRIQQASLPAANGYFSARSLAKFYNSLAVKSPLLPNGIFQRLNSEASLQQFGSVNNEVMLQGNDGKFNSGFMVYSRGSDGESAVRTCGHSGIGGSIGLCDVSQGGDVYAIAITTNR